MKIVVRNTRGFSKMKGLIGQTNPEAILITTRFGIHTFGLRFPIDLAVLDDAGVVQTIRKGFQPNGIFLWSPRFNRILELPAGTLEKKKIKKGIEITLILNHN